MFPGQPSPRSGFLGQAQDLLERLHVAHRVVDGIVVMDGPSEPLPALGVAPVPVEAGRLPPRCSRSQAARRPATSASVPTRSPTMLTAGLAGSGVASNSRPWNVSRVSEWTAPNWVSTPCTGLVPRASQSTNIHGVFSSIVRALSPTPARPRHLPRRRQGPPALGRQPPSGVIPPESTSTAFTFTLTVPHAQTGWRGP